MIRPPFARLLLTAAALATLSPATLSASGPVIARPPQAMVPHLPAQDLRMIRPHRVCKPAVHTAQSTVSAADARSRWAAQAHDLHGTSWATWTAAANRDETMVQGFANRIYFASGRPCRSLIVAP